MQYQRTKSTAMQSPLCVSILLVCLVCFLMKRTEAVANGEPDSGRHPWAGYIASPDRGLASVSGCSSPAAYYSCGGSLVNIPGLPTRRMFLTAGHCVGRRLSTDLDLPFLIHFLEQDLRIIENCTVAPRVVGVSVSEDYLFKGVYSWNGPWKGNDIAVGNGDYALVLLDKPVPRTIVPVLPQIYNTLGTQQVGNTITQDTLPTVGMVDYGIVGWGTRADNSLGQPLIFSGPRVKQYIEMPVLSIFDWMFTTSTSAVQDDPSACTGDAGSAAMNIWNSTIYGVTSGGDMWCRGINTFSRVGTSEFWTWLNRIKIEIVTKSYSKTIRDS